jgi:hypothetical protein
MNVFKSAKFKEMCKNAIDEYNSHCDACGEKTAYPKVYLGSKVFSNSLQMLDVAKLTPLCPNCYEKMQSVREYFKNLLIDPSQSIQAYDILNTLQSSDDSLCAVADEFMMQDLHSIAKRIAGVNS